MEDHSAANRASAEELEARARAASAAGDAGLALQLVLRALRLCDSESGRILKADLEKDVEAAQAVRRVLSAPPSAHYSVMNLRPGCSAAELKKQYKVLSLELHPDRNHTEGAEDAFKRLSGAFEALSKRVGEPQHNPNGSTRGTASRVSEHGLARDRCEARPYPSK